MKYYLNTETDDVYGYDDIDPTQLSYIETAINNGWTDITDSWPPKDTVDEQKIILNYMIQCELDRGSCAWGFSSLHNALSFSTSSIPQKVAESDALKQWRDDLHIWMYSVEDDITSDTDLNELFLSAPAKPDKPIV